ncbi:MAG: ArsR family transcriptional regulator [Chloroflexi bacterium]|nr:MAG: ArsR family transcriptional regulator [Chloroflexota bacterium]
MLHPVRMRILMALTGSQGMTPLQLAEALNDVPQATLYRHINRLAKSGLLVVVDERPVRGTLEKVYAVNSAVPTHLGNEAFTSLSKEDHLRYFTAFAISLIDEFSRYVNHSPKIDLAADGVGYHQLVLFMSDEELVAFAQAVNQALLPFLQNQPAPERKKRLFSTIMMPEVSGK